MTTAGIEKLYIEHAEYFRALLAGDYRVYRDNTVGVIGGSEILWAPPVFPANPGRWVILHGGPGGLPGVDPANICTAEKLARGETGRSSQIFSCTIPEAIAVAAMTEAWRNTFAAKYSIEQDVGGDVDVSRRDGCYCAYPSMTHALCAIAKAEAAAREAKEAKKSVHKPIPHPSAIMDRMDAIESKVDNICAHLGPSVVLDGTEIFARDAAK